jgi:DNA end-binding protein Ku
MARAVWSGAISFGLINIPVKLYSAISPKAVRFNQIDPSNNARIRTRKVNAETGEEVDSADLVKGYEVTITDDELAALQPRATHTIDLEEFVELVEVDPIYFDGAFHVAPGTGAAKPYTLLVEALDKAGKVAVARFVMRSKQYVAVMRPVDGRLLLSMMVYADELNPATDIPEFDTLADVEVTDRELVMAEELIESLSAEFEPARFRDTYREDLMGLIEAKAAGAAPALEAPSAPSDDVVVDLMAALERSVAAAKEARGRHPSVGGAEKPAAGAEKAPATGASAGKAAPAKGSTAKKAPAKATAENAPAKKAPAKKAPAKKATAKKAPAKKATAKKATAKKALAAKVAAEKAPVRKTA